MPHFQLPSACFRFLLDAQQDHTGEQEDVLQRLVEGWRAEEAQAKQQGGKSIAFLGQKMTPISESKLAQSVI